MNLNLLANLTTFDDKPILHDGVPAPASFFYKQALIADNDETGKPVASDKKLARFELFLKLRSADKNTDFTLDEVALLDRAVLVYPTIIAGQLHYLLAQKTP